MADEVVVAMPRALQPVSRLEVVWTPDGGPDIREFLIGSDVITKLIPDE